MSDRKGGFLPAVAWSGSATILSTVTQFAGLPVLVSHLGAHGTGIIALGWLVTAMCGCLELGLSPAVSGEIARRRGAGSPVTSSLLRAFEIPCWAIVGIIITGLAIWGPAVAHAWIPAASASDMATAVALMGFPAAVTLPLSLYMNGLMACDQPKSAAIVRMVGSAGPHAAGALVIILGAGPAGWMLAAGTMALMGALIGRVLLARELVRTPTVDWSGLYAARAVIAGLAVVGIFSAMIGSLDRVIVSRLLPTDGFAAFALATMVASGFRLAATPVFTVAYPRFASGLAGNQIADVRRIYLRTSRWMSACMCPGLAILVLYGEPLIYWWCGDYPLAKASSQILGMLAVGAVLNALMTLPYAIQVADKQTRLSSGIVITSLILMVIILWAATPIFGAPGAALASPLTHIIVMVASIYFTHRFVQIGPSQDWYVAIAGPALACALISFAAFWLSPDPTIADGVAWSLAILILPIGVAYVCDHREPRAGT